MIHQSPSSGAQSLTAASKSQWRQFDLLEAVNRNPLVFFLLANLMTGLVNLAIKTHELSPTTALVVLLLYTLTLSAITATLHVCNVTVKFW